MLRIDTQTKSTTAEVVKERVIRNDPDAILKSDEMQRSLLERINNGSEFSHLDEGVLKMTKAFLAAIFSPLQVSLEFKANETSDGLSFIDFIESKNREIEEKIRDLKSQQVIPDEA